MVPSLFAGCSIRESDGSGGRLRVYQSVGWSRCCRCIIALCVSTSWCIRIGRCHEYPVKRLRFTGGWIESPEYSKSNPSEGSQENKSIEVSKFPVLFPRHFPSFPIPNYSVGELNVGSEWRTTSSRNESAVVQVVRSEFSVSITIILHYLWPPFVYKPSVGYFFRRKRARMPNYPFWSKRGLAQVRSGLGSTEYLVLSAGIKFTG